MSKKTPKSSKKENAAKAPVAKAANKAARNAPKDGPVATVHKAANEAATAKHGEEKAAPAPKRERADSKKAKVLELLRRPNGATLKEIQAATDWRAHSVRGFISGNLSKKMGLKVASAKREDGERTYQISA